MWVEILCGLLAYKVIQRVFFAGGDDASYLADLDSSHSDLCFAVASRLEKLYAGRCFVGLRIPDPDAGERQHIDVVLVTKREVMVVAIKNFSGFVEADKDGNWSCPTDKKRKHEIFPNPVLEVNRLAANLQSYLEQRGAKLPDGHIIGRVVLPNPNCRLSYTISIQPEVMLYDQWKDLKTDSKSGLSAWIKGWNSKETKMFLVNSLSSKVGMRTFNFSKISRGQKSVDSSSRSQLFLVVSVGQEFKYCILLVIIELRRLHLQSGKRFL